MSLIPSESYSFPDHFTSTVTPSRKPKQKPEEVKAVRKPTIVALPDPEPEPELEAFVEAEPVAEAEFAPELEAAPELEVAPEPWEPELEPEHPPMAIVEAKQAAKPELMAELWEPEIPEVKAAPPAPRVPNPLLSRVRAMLPRAPKPVVELDIDPAPSEPEVPQIKVVPAPPPVRPAPPAPNPALRRAQAPPPKIPDPPVRKIALPATLKPKVRWNNRAAPLDPARNGANGNGAHQPPPTPPPAPAQNVIPMKAAKPAPTPLPKLAPRPVQMAPPVPRPVAPALRPAQPAPVLQKPVQHQPSHKPAVVPTQARPVQPRPRPAPPNPAPPVFPAPQPELFEMFEENGYEAAAQRRKQMKFRRFVTCEAATLLVLLPLVILGLTLNISAPAIRWIMNILTIAAAVAAAVIPIVFYAATPTLPEIER